MSEEQRVYEKSIEEAIGAMEQAAEALESSGNYPTSLRRLLAALEDVKRSQRSGRTDRIEADPPVQGNRI